MIGARRFVRRRGAAFIRFGRDQITHFDHRSRGANRRIECLTARYKATNSVSMKRKGKVAGPSIPDRKTDPGSIPKSTGDPGRDPHESNSAIGLFPVKPSLSARSRSWMPWPGADQGRHWFSPAQLCLAAAAMNRRGRGELGQCGLPPCFACWPQFLMVFEGHDGFPQSCDLGFPGFCSSR